MKRRYRSAVAPGKFEQKQDPDGWDAKTHPGTVESVEQED